MPRIARVVVPGIPHHITQRGNYGQVVFGEDEDRVRYLQWVREYSNRYYLTVWGYTLMDNHVHFIAVPQNSDSLARTFNQAHMRYSQYYNHRMRRRGHLWQGRFYSCPLDEAHLYSGLRYVERNAVRAGLVERAEDYRWSSALSHIEGLDDPILSNDLPLLEEITDWREYLSEPEDEVIIERLRRCTSTGRPMGSASFVKEIEGLLGRVLVPHPIGRPRKTKKR
jgi:putative transposase